MSLVRPVHVRRDGAPVARVSLDVLLDELRAVAWRAYAPDFTNEFVSSAAGDVFGYPAKYWQRPGFWQTLTHPEDLAALLVIGDEVMRTGDVVDVEYRVRHADGRMLWVMDRVAPLHDEAGRAVGLQGLMLDVTERRSATVDLQNHATRAQLALDIAGVTDWEWHPVGDRVARGPANPPWLLPDADPKAASAARFLNAVHPDDRARVRLALDTSIATGEPFACDFRMVRPDGDVRHMVSRGRVRDAGSPDPVLIGATRDVTDELRARSEIDEWRERFGVAAAASGVMLFDHDVASDSLVWHTGDGTVAGHPVAEIATLAQWCAHMLPEDQVAFTASYSSSLQFDVQATDVVYRIRDAQGRIRTLEARGTTLWRGGVAYRTIGLVVDVTDRDSMAQQVQLHTMLLDTIGEGLALARDDGTIVFANAAMERLYGYPRAQIIGMSMARLSARAEADFGTRLESLKQRVLRDGMWSGESLGRHADGRPIRILVSMTCATVGNERLWVSVRTDVTEARRLEQAVQVASERQSAEFARELHEGLGQQLTGIALLAGSLHGEALRAGSPHAAQIARLTELVTQAVGTCRRMAQGVSAYVMFHGGIELGLRDLALQCEREHGGDIVIEVERVFAATLGEAASLHLYRIAEQAIRSAVHAGAPLRFALALAPHGIQGRLLLGLPGVEPAALYRADEEAVRVMGYHAGLLGANFTVRPGRAGGTEIECVFPLAGSASIDRGELA